MWALEVPTARVSTGGVGSSRAGSLGLGCKSSPGALGAGQGLMLGWWAGPYDVAVQDL